MEDLSLHILDVAENSVTAGAKNIEILVTENKEEDILRIDISDDGKGMDSETIRQAADPFFTHRTTRRVGLGLALLNQAAKMANGTMEIESTVNKGTHVWSTFQLSHIDRQPLGKLSDTITALIAGNPDIDIKFTYTNNGYKFIFDTKEVKRRIKDIPINSASTLLFIRQFLSENIKENLNGR